MKIGNIEFPEPMRLGVSAIVESAALYVILTRSTMGLYREIYIGQTEDLAERFSSHNKWQCWDSNKESEGLFFTFIKVPDKEKRIELETYLRKQYPAAPCNKQ